MSEMPGWPDAAWSLRITVAVGSQDQSMARSSILIAGRQVPHAIHWVYDTYALAKGTASAIMKQGGGDRWFFITADYAFGHALELETSAIVTQNGGKVLGAVRA